MNKKKKEYNTGHFEVKGGQNDNGEGGYCREVSRITLISCMVEKNQT